MICRETWFLGQVVLVIILKLIPHLSLLFKTITFPPGLMLIRLLGAFVSDRIVRRLPSINRWSKFVLNKFRKIWF